jgi:hypothetical protein
MLLFGGTERVRNIVWLRVKIVHYLGTSRSSRDALFEELARAASAILVQEDPSFD